MKRKLALERWADGGAIVVAVLAALALAVTVLVARAEFASATQSMARGEGDALYSRIHEHHRGHPPYQEDLDVMLEELGPSGVRYVAVIDGDDVIEAGTSTIDHSSLGPGTFLQHGDRALVARPLPGGPRGERARPPRRPLLVMEFIPSVLPRVQAGLNRTFGVAAIAVAILLVLAMALTVRAVRRSAAERKAEHTRRLVALGQMSAVMAHELRNPLASLKGHAQLLEEMLGAGSKERTKASLVVNEAQRMERLTTDLLSFVRDAELSRENITPEQLVDRVLAQVAPGRVEVDLVDAPKLMWVDQSRLGVAIDNLVRNALQAGEASVVLRVREANRTVRIEVCDHGPGITEGDAEDIFEPFFTTRVSGTGLGLPVARRAVEQHGGTLSVETAPNGHGAVFVVTLPDAARAS